MMTSRFHIPSNARPGILPLKTSDRFARLALAVLALAHLVIAASLILVIWAATNRAFAAEGDNAAAACTGQNLAEKLAEDDPGALEEAEREAAMIVNGEGLLWTIEGDGTRSWLFGTMHSADPAVHDLSGAAEAAIRDARTLVIESSEILEPERAQLALLSKPELTMFTDGTSLKTLMSPADYETVSSRLEELGLPIAAVTRMKPWMLAGLVATSRCETAWRETGREMLDIALAERFLNSDRPVVGIETIEEQMSAMASLPIELHVRGLVETIELGSALDDVMATMTALYRQERVGMIMPILKTIGTTGGSDVDAAGYAAFEEQIVTARNHTMAERLDPILREGSAFVAVGALHLPGEEGLVALLREAGYDVERAGL